MVEKQAERSREPEPEWNHYEATMAHYKKFTEARSHGKVLLKYKDIPWFQSRQALLRQYTSPINMDEMAAPYWNVFRNRVFKQSGKHRHQGGIPIFAVGGKGYSIVDGVRYNWKAGDMIVLPFKPGGVEHQHFNEDPNAPAEWIAFRYVPFAEASANLVTQTEAHPDWLAQQKKK